MKFKHKVVVITGSSQGIGKAVALKFANKGAKLVINSRNSVAKGEATVEEIEALGGRAIYVQGDLSKPEDVSHLFQETVSAFGTIDILINNAGNPAAIAFDKLTKDTFLEAINDNLTSTVLCCVEASKIMKENGSGSIINTSSMRGIDHVGGAGIMGYSVAKAGINMLTKTLAKELVGSNITVNAVAPGYVSSEYIESFSDEVKQRWLANIPIGRFITPEEIADSYLFLAESAGITGAILLVDGGFTLKMP